MTNKMEASKNYKFWSMAIFGFVIIRFLWNLQDKKYVEDFLDKNYESIILKVPLKDDNNKGLYYYQCQNFDGKIEEISINNRLLFGSALKGDTLLKIKGDSSIIIKRRNIVLKFPFHGIFYNRIDTVLVR
jgi:hypothetical protein